MLETEARRQRIVDARAGRQLAMQHLALEVARRRRDRAAAKAGRGIDPLRLVGAGDEGGRVALDVREQARDGRPCAPARRPSTEAVGLTSPFSMRESEARLTPLSAESSSSDHRLARLSSRRRSARRRSAESRERGLVFPYEENTPVNENVKAQCTPAARPSVVIRANPDELRSTRSLVLRPNNRATRCRGPSPGDLPEARFAIRPRRRSPCRSGRSDRGRRSP